MTLLFFLLVAPLLEVFCLQEETGFRTALSFISKLRHCAMQSEHHCIKLPELTAYAETSNSVVNDVLEEVYVKFWQALRERDYEQDLKRLLHYCKGAAMGLYLSPDLNPVLCLFSGAKEAALLRPLYKETFGLFMKSKSSKGKNALQRLMMMVEENALGYDRLKMEMSLRAIRFLDLALVISKCSWYASTLHELDSLRTGDRALHYIRDWDFNATVPRIMYLTYILHARQIITYLSEPGEKRDDESQKVAKLQEDLEQVILTEFPSQMMMKIGGEMDVNYSINFVEKMVRTRPIIRSVHLMSVKPPRKNNGALGNLYLEGDVLYITVVESIGEKHRDGWEGFYYETIKRITQSSFTMCNNPSILYPAK